MAATHPLKIYDQDGFYVASTKRYELAAAMVAMLGDGATVRLGHPARNTLWREGTDGFAADSYDEASLAMIKVERHLRAPIARRGFRCRQCGGG